MIVDQPESRDQLTGLVDQLAHVAGVGPGSVVASDPLPGVKLPVQVMLPKLDVGPAVRVTDGRQDISVHLGTEVKILRQIINDYEQKRL